MKRVLFIAYNFPPVGGAGVQRSTKFVKYLPGLGWLPSVLTVANPSVPALDGTLLKDIPDSVPIHRARTWEPGYAAKASVSPSDVGGMAVAARFSTLAKSVLRRTARMLLQPDPQVLWIPEALRRGKRVLEETPHHAILVSGPPFSSFFVGARLSRHYGLPLLLDFRDEWDISSAYWENRSSDPLSRFLQSRMQAWLIRRASALLATTRRSAEALKEKCARVACTPRVEYIYNGFDPTDFAGGGSETLRTSDAVLRIAYVGTLWNLTSIEPLVRAVEKLAAERPESAARLELSLAGRRTPDQQAIVDRLKRLPCRVVEHAYLEHDAAVALLRASDIACVLLSAVPGAERVVPAKLFECIALQKEILAIGPRGEVWDLLESYPAKCLADPHDVGSIAQYLMSKLHDVSQPFVGAEWNRDRFSRPEQAGELSRILEWLSP